ncbi:hypothetical protein [Hypericibacter adhaerens]|uniref:hypothetical protein n=1 Tax=Hypericibacter adhaerens TaxID=2602016 RepID=UPI001246457B|nr:hypothetical protein [Hypericibacter adhaerens]
MSSIRFPTEVERRVAISLQRCLPLLVAAGLAGCAGETKQAAGLSRETRSENYCARLAGTGTGYYDQSLLLECRREEYTAAARVRGRKVPGDVDAGCAATASMGDPLLLFSWSRYALCVERLAPPPAEP